MCKLSYRQDGEKVEFMTPKEIRELTGLSQIAFCSKYHIPFKTYQKWEQGTNICPSYVLELLEFKVRYDHVFIVNDIEYSIDQAATYMDHDIRERLHDDIAPCSAQEFWGAYSEIDLNGAKEIIRML